MKPCCIRYCLWFAPLDRADVRDTRSDHSKPVIARSSIRRKRVRQDLFGTVALPG